MVHEDQSYKVTETRRKKVKEFQFQFTGINNPYTNSTFFCFSYLSDHQPYNPKCLFKTLHPLQKMIP